MKKLYHYVFAVALALIAPLVMAMPASATGVDMSTSYQTKDLSSIDGASVPDVFADNSIIKKDNLRYFSDAAGEHRSGVITCNTTDSLGYRNLLTASALVKPHAGVMAG